MDKFKNLIAWKRAKELTKKIYISTKSFPKDEIYGLTSQMRRAAVSIPSNIAEGYGRQHDKEFIQFLYQARGPLMELKTQIDIAFEVGYLSKSQSIELDNLATEVYKLLNALISAKKGNRIT